MLKKTFVNILNKYEKPIISNLIFRTNINKKLENNTAGAATF